MHQHAAYRLSLLGAKHGANMPVGGRPNVWYGYDPRCFFECTHYFGAATPASATRTAKEMIRLAFGIMADVGYELKYAELRTPDEKLVHKEKEL